MKPLRLVILTRRYWPLVGGVPAALGYLAQGLRHSGIHVTVLTPRWQPDWPAELDKCGVRVVRPVIAPRGRWGKGGYRRGLKRWLRGELSNFDAVYAAGLGIELEAAVAAAAQRMPVVARPISLAEIRSRSGTLQRYFHRRWRRATRFAVVSSSMADELRRAGIDENQTCLLPIGVHLPPERSEQMRQAARRELAAANPLLAVAADSPLVLSAGELRLGNGLENLVAAWREVAYRLPSARLWVVGAGPQRDELATLIDSLGLKSCVALPGRYDSLDDFYQAADAFVQSAERETPSVAVTEALAAGLPVIMAESNGYLPAGAKATINFHFGDSAALTAALLSVLEDRNRAAALGAAGRQLAEVHFSLSAVVGGHVQLLQSLVCNSLRSGERW